jgi:hypothetical protein
MHSRREASQNGFGCASGDLIIRSADQIVWLDLPITTWRAWPGALRAFPVVRLCPAAEVTEWLEALSFVLDRRGQQSAPGLATDLTHSTRKVS